MLSPRTRRALLAAGAFAGGAAMAVPLVAPELLRRKILSAIHERTGLNAELAGVSLGVSEATLTGLRVSGTLRGGEIDATFEEARVSVEPLALLGDPLVAIDRVHVRGGAVTWVAPRAEAGDGASATSGSTGTRSLPPLSLEGVSLSLGDADGELVHVDALAGEWNERGAHAEAHGIRIDGGSSSWIVTEATVRLTRPGESLLVAGVTVEGATLTVQGNEEARLARLRALRPRRAATGEGGARAELLERLDPAFSAELGGVSISLLAEDGTESVGLTDLSASVERTSGRLTTEGHARPGESGRLGWDLLLEPSALRVSGTVDLLEVPFAIFAPLLPALPLHAPENARVSGMLSLARGDDGSVRGSGSLDVTGLGFSHPRIASAPVTNLAFGVRGDASWEPEARTLHLSDVIVHVPASTGATPEARLSGTVVWQPERYAVDLSATLPATPCDDVVHAIPHDVLGELSAMSLEGRFGASIDLDVDSADLDHTTLRIRVADGCRFVTVPPFADPARFSQPFHHRVEENDGDVFEMDTGPGTLAWTPISQMSPFLLHAVVAHEDASFFTHSGFATWAIRDALVDDLRAGRYVRGASTITMQLVKNAFLHREKTLVRKVQEVLLTWWVETAMTKEQILELYLNVIELGDRVYGIRDAAHSWFGREPAELSAAESVYLAMILPNPPAFSAEHRREGRPPESFRRRMAGFLRHLGERGRYDAAAVEAGLADIEAMRFFHPDEAPPGPRALIGSTSVLPIGAFEDAIAPEGLTLSDDVPSEDEASTDDGWDRWEEVVP